RDKISISYIKVTFPQDFNFAGSTNQWFSINPMKLKSYIEITNPASSSRIWDVTDHDNPVIIGTNTSGGILSAVVPNTNSLRKLYVSNQVLTPQIRSAGFQLQSPGSINYLIVTHQSLLSAAQQYASYRGGTSGGSYSPSIITIDEVYDQF